jgi:hypothetical protein
MGMAYVWTPLGQAAVGIDYELALVKKLLAACRSQKMGLENITVCTL